MVVKSILRTLCDEMLLLLMKLKVHFNRISHSCAASWCSAAVTELGAGREGVRGNCTYKLFKLYEMHVVHTCLSIYDV